MTNVYDLAGCTPTLASLANINGRMYKDVSFAVGIQSCSYLTIASTASTNISSGNSAIQIRLLELIILRAFISGLNNVISPLGLRYAFNPSNVS